MQQHRLFCSFGLVAVLLCAAMVAWPTGIAAQSVTGKISGRVTDASTGEPLPGANVVISGTRLGATVGVNGEYFVLQVPPGTYEVSSSLVGYQTVGQTGVQVLVDRTATIDFALRQTDQALDDLIVTAEQDPVQMDVSFAQQALTQEELEAVPVGPRLRDQVASLVGVDTDAWGITIRGEESTRIGFNVDGVTAADHRQQRSYTSFSKTGIKQVQILTGGFNAEHGNVKGGVVNFVTKEPNTLFVAADGQYNPAGKKHFGPDVYSSENWWDVGRFESFSPTADTNGDGEPDFNGWTQEFETRSGASGTDWVVPMGDPITTPQQARGVWEWQHRQFDGNDPAVTPAFTNSEDSGQYNRNVGDHESDYMWDATVGAPILQDLVGFTASTRKERMAYPFNVSRVSYRDNTTQLKLVFTPTATTKLTAQYIRGWQEGGHQGNNVGVPFRTQQAVFEHFNHTRVFMPSADFQVNNIIRNHGLISWSHTLSPKTFYNLSARFGQVDWITKWHPQKLVSDPLAAVDAQGNITRVNEASAATARAAGSVILSEAPFGWNYKPGGNDILGIYRMQGGGGNSRAGDWSEIWENDFSADITSQITPNHQIKVGAQIHHFSLHENRGMVPSAVPEFSDPRYKDEYTGARTTSTGTVEYAWQGRADADLPTGTLATGAPSTGGNVNGDIWTRDNQYGPDNGIDEPAISPNSGLPLTSAFSSDQLGQEVFNESDVSIGSATGDHNNYWVKTPVFGGFFAQDRMEFRSIVANIGARMDFHRPDLFFDLPNETHLGWFGRNAEYVYLRTRLVRPSTTWAFSPRFGASYPITDLSKMFLNYGHFNQLVNTRDMYRTQSGLGQSLEFLGNPWMKMERTIQYEMGYERSFAGKYLATGTVYFKDTESEGWARGSMRGEFNVGGPNSSQNAFAVDARGIELKFQQTRGKFFTGFVSWDIRVARVRNTGYQTTYDRNTVSNPTMTVLANNPNHAVPPFKAKPIWKLGGNFRTPLDYGGDMAMLQGGWNLGFFFDREAGEFFNYNPGNADASVVNQLNAQWKDEWAGHIRISKMFDMPGAPMLYMEINNPFNFKNTHTLDGGNRDDTFGVKSEDTPRAAVGSQSGGRAFNYPNTSGRNRFEAYMTSLGWTVDSSGNLKEGSRPGGSSAMDYKDMRRPYMLFGDRRDVKFGARFSF